MTPSDSRTSFSRPEAHALWVIWITYGSFYFCRTNIAAAVPGMQEEFHFTKEQIGMILGSLKIAYGVGQFINGQLAEKFSPRKMLAVGMLASAGLNIVFGFGTAVYFLLFVWATNGYFQSFGWTPCMRVTANWFPPVRRGKAIGIIGTGYQATAAFTFLMSGFAADQFGWRGALYVPAILFGACCVHMLFFLKEENPDAAPSSARESRDAKAPPVKSEGRILDNILTTLSNPGLWFLAGSLGLLNACRYGFLDWGLLHLVETQGISVGKSALKIFVLPLGGIPGAFLAGWATDKFFGGRRAPVIIILLLSLGTLTLVYNAVVQTGPWLSMFILVLIGFCIYGPQVLLVGAAPIDLARKGTPAAAVGFVNFVGYMGAFSGDYITGSLTDRHGWEGALFFWAGSAFAAAFLMCFLWRRKPEPVR